jgi:hypothetical protein
MEAVGVARHQYKMDMVAHQAISNHFNDLPLRVVANQIEVSDAIAAIEEHALAMIAALGDVVWQTGKHDPSVARHACTVPIGSSPAWRIDGVWRKKLTKVNVPFINR